MTSDLPPASIAYAIPEHDRVDGRVRRVLALAAIAFGAVGVGSTLVFLALAFGLIPSSLYGGGRTNPQTAFQVLNLLFDVSSLIGGALLLADLPAGRWLIRVGFGVRLATSLAAIAMSMAKSSYPSSLTVGDRVYLVIGNSLAYLIVPVTLFLLTFALPPRRKR